jgi:hypothetical protein
VSGLTAEYRIKYQIIRTVMKWTGDPSADDMSSDEIDRMWEMTEGGDHADDLQDAMESFREGGEESGIPSKDYSRHYENEDRAKRLDDGTWVGWTYWHGGGKHGEPSAIDWLSDAYFLTATEEQKTVTVRTFAKLA